MDNKCFDILLDKLNKFTKKTILNKDLDIQLLYNLSIYQKIKIFCNYLDTLDKKQLNNEFQEIILKCGKK